MVMSSDDVRELLEDFLNEQECQKQSQENLSKLAKKNREWINEIEESIASTTNQELIEVEMKYLKTAHEVRLGIEKNQEALTRTVKSVETTIQKLKDQLN